MSRRGVWNWAAANDSIDWNDVVAGTASLTLTSTIPYGESHHFYNHPNASASDTFVEIVGPLGGGLLGNLKPSGASAFQGLTANKTVNIPAGSTSAQIQALIDAEDKNLNGYTLNFQFANGTYANLGTINICDFFGGKVNVLGDPTDNSVSTIKNVDLQLTADSIFYICNVSDISMKYIRLLAQYHTTISAPILQIESTNAYEVRYFAIVGPGAATYARSVVNRSIGDIRQTAFSGTYKGITSGIASDMNLNGNSFSGTVGTHVEADRGHVISVDAVTSYVETNSGTVRDNGGFKS